MLMATHLVGFGAGGSGAPSTPALVDRTTGTHIGDLAGGSTGVVGQCFDNTTSEDGATVVRKASNGYVGTTWGAGKYIQKVVVYGSNDDGFTIGTPQRSDNNIWIYAKNGTPSSGTDGTIIGSLTAFTDIVNESSGRTITSTDQATAYTSVWIYGTTGAGAFGVAELQIWELV
jgi:hypothetical protein